MGGIKRNKTREALIHFKLFFELETLKGKTALFDRIEPELVLSGQKRADLVLYKNNKPVLVIECKKYSSGRECRSIDPLAHEVVNQAMGYAAELGAPFFVTYNGEVGVLFQTHQTGIPILERNTAMFRGVCQNHQKFSGDLLTVVEQAVKGKYAWADFDHRFIGRLSSIHSLLVPQVTTVLMELYRKKAPYIAKVRAWFESFGVEWDPKQTTKIQEKLLPAFAAQASYVLLDKLLFYKVLERKYSKLPKLKPQSNFEEVFNVVDRCFSAVLEIDYLPIFHPDELFSDRKLFKNNAEEVNDFIRSLSEIKLTSLDGNHLGAIYETLLPPQIRHDLGQYYTPPNICELLTTWAVRQHNSNVLDPACGSGGFLGAIYERLGKLNPKLSHKEILDLVHGIEINRFPAHLSAMNLALKDLDSHTNFLNVSVKDFFDSAIQDSIGNRKLDAVVGNPPYIRQELIPDKDRCRDHLSEKQKSFIPSRSDIYVYFITKALKMLKEDGRLSFIVSNRWLQTDYGDKLQEYLLQYSQPVALVSFDKNVFDDALIGTVCLFLEAKSTVNESSEVQFIRVHKAVSQKVLLQAINGKYTETRFTKGAISIRKMTVKKLKETKVSWRELLYAPEIFSKLQANKYLVPLSHLADCERGITSGCNPFFYRDKKEAMSLGLSRKFFKPLLKSVGQLVSTDFGDVDTEWLVFDINKLAEEACRRAQVSTEGSIPLSANDSKKVLRELSKIASPELVRAIEEAEAANFHKVASFANKRVWWSLGELITPSFALTKEVWREFRTPILKDNVICDQHLYPIYPKENLGQAQKMALGAVLNSSLVWLMREVQGREASGEALSRNEISVDEAKNLLVPDVSTFSAKQVKALNSAFALFIKYDRMKQTKKREKYRKIIDQVVLKALRSPCSYSELIVGLKECLDRRERAAHQDRETMVAV